MTLSSQLEAMRRQKASLPNDNHGGSTRSVGAPAKPDTGEFSFLRRKLAQFRSGKWKKSQDGANMVRSQSWNHGLQSPSKLQSEWSTSLTSLMENEVAEDSGRTAGPPRELSEPEVDRGRIPLTRSQSVYHKVPPPEVVKFRRNSQEERGLPDKKRPVSYGGSTSQFYRTLDETETETDIDERPLAASCERLADDEDFFFRSLSFSRIGFRRSMHCTPSLSSSRAKILRKYSNQEEGRSRSLTHMDALEPGAVFKDVDKEPSRLIVPPLQERRQKLTRSQVSSSEYFSVSFEVGSNAEGDEFVVASKGTSLAEALNSVCLKRGIDITNVNVYLDSYKTPLPLLTTETSWLGGKHILIKEKNDQTQTTSQRAKGKFPQSQVSHSRKSSVYRGRGGRFFSASTEDAAVTESPESCGKPKSSKQRWSGLFGNTKDTKMEALVDHLNNYSKHGIPQLSNADEDLEEALYNLEEDWRDIVAHSTSLPERVQQQQTAIWELVHTEVAYIHTLKVVTDLFLSCLTNLQAANILTDVDKSRLFSNITEIYSSNRLFWSSHVLPMLSASRESRSTLNPQLMLDGFIRFEDIFRPYTKYCAEQSQCQQYCREKHTESELFTAYLVWCETQKDCNRLRLMDILVKPMQRITKYSLLLKAIQKHTELEDLRQSLDQMIKRVDMFVNSVNTTLRQKQELERLRAVIARIEAYDVVESKDEDLERLVRSYNDLDLTCPMPGCCNSQRRQLLIEGDLKIKDNVTSKMDVHCFLFTDMLLVCKATNRRSEGKFRVLRQPYLVERLVVQELCRDPATLAVVYLSEYRVPCGAFLLSSSDTKALKNWAVNIKKAQEMYASAKQATTARGHSILALSRQPSSYLEDEWQEENEVDTHSVASLGLFPLKSPRGSTRGSSLNHSHSGSVEMENSSMSASSVSQSRGVSVENEIRGSSQSSDEGAPVNERGYHSTSPRGDRRKCTSPNTLSIQVPVFSCLGQSLPDLNLVMTSAGPSGSMLLVPPRSSPHRGTSYPPPSPPLRRAPALVLSRNPPLLKTRHVASTGSTLVTTSCEVDIPVIAGVEEEGESSGQSQQKSMMKRLTRTDKRYHTAGVIEEIKRLDTKDSSIHKRLSWNCGGASNDAAHLHLQRSVGPGLSSDSVRSSSGVSSTGESVSSGLNVDSDGLRELREMYHESFVSTNTPPASPMSEQQTPRSSSLASSRSQLAEIILNDPSLESSDV